MTITTVDIVCDVGLPDNTEFPASRIDFRLSGPDYDTVSNDVIPAVTVSAILDGSGTETVGLWPVDRGIRNTFYSVILQASLVVNGRTIAETFTLGRIAPPSDEASYGLADLLAQSTGGITVGSKIYATLADAVAAALAAAEDAQEWTPEYAQSLLDQLNDQVADAQAAATEAALYDGPKVDTFSGLASVTSSMLDDGELIRVIESNGVFERVTSGGDLNYSGTGGVRLQAVGGVFRTSQFGVKGDPLIDDTAAFQACINAAKRAATSLTTEDKRVALIHDVPQAFVNGLVIDFSNLTFHCFGELLSFAPQSDLSYVLTMGGTGPDVRARWQHAYGVKISGRYHTNVGGFRQQYYAHCNFPAPVIRRCRGSGLAGAGLDIIQGWDSPVWGGFVTLCGQAGDGATFLEKLQNSTPAMRITASPTLSSNRLQFNHLTFEANSGIDLYIERPLIEGEIFNQVVFANCKWEQAADLSIPPLYLGVWAPRAIQSLEFIGETYIAGYTRDGAWCDIDMGGSGQLCFSPETAMGMKNSIPNNNIAPYCKVRGNGHLTFPVQIKSSLIDAGVVVLDTTGKPNEKVDYTGVKTYTSRSLPWKWIDQFGEEKLAIARNGLMYLFVNVPQRSSVEVKLPYTTGHLKFLPERGPSRSYMAVIRSEATGTPIIEMPLTGSAVETFIGSIPAERNGFNRLALNNGRSLTIISGFDFDQPTLISMEASY